MGDTLAWLERWMAAVVRRRRGVLLAAAALALASLYVTVDRLRIDTDTTGMISAETRYRQNAIAFRQAFPELHGLLVLVLDGAAVEEVEAAADALAAELAVRPGFAEVWAPGSEAFFRRNGLLYLDEGSLGALADRMAASAPLLSALAADPSLHGLFGVLRLGLRHVDSGAVPEASLVRLIDAIAASAEATVRGKREPLSWRHVMELDEAAGDGLRLVVAKPRLDHASLSPAAAAVREVREAARALGIDGARVRLRLTGPVALNYEELKSAEAGGKVAGALSLVAVLVLLGFGLRSPGLTFATLVTLLAGLAWTAGFATLAVGQLNLISIAFAVLFVGLGVDFSIHFCLRFLEAGGADRAGAIARAARGSGRGIAISAAGAAIGFYAFLPTDYRGFAELGLIAGTGMFIALIATFTLLPALLAALAVARAQALPRRELWRWTDRLVARHHRRVLLAAAVLGLGGLALLPRLAFDFDPLNLKDPDSESFVTYQELARDPKYAIHAAEVLVPDRAAADRTAAALGGLAEVASTRTLASLVPAGQPEKLAIIQDMAFFLAPALQPRQPPAVTDAQRGEATAALLAALSEAGGGAGLRQASARLAGALVPLAEDATALVALEQALTGHLPALFARLREALEAQAVDLDDLPAALRRQWVAEDGRYRVQALPTEELTGTRAFVDAVLAEVPNATGTPVNIAEGARVVIGAFVEATLIAVAAIALMLFALYRRLALLVLALGPLTLAAVLTLATSVLLGPTLNFANVIVLPLLFGLGMASAVHMVERQRQLEPGAELMATTTPRAVLFSTLTTLASFGSLALSAHRGMASMGLLLTLAVVYMLLATLVVLPSLMHWTGKASK